MRNNRFTRTICAGALALAASTLACLPGFAGEPPADPILQLDPGMHTAAVKRVALDAAARYLVSSSDDKTVRVWETATGRQLTVLRPPIGTGHEGKLYAVALSPDGRTVACGGWTGMEWDQTMSIYLFERGNGQLVRRLAGVPNAINHLVFSPNGQFLVAMLGGGKGMRVYSTNAWTLVAEDHDYGDSSYGAAFDSQGRLATTAYDGFVRLYDPQFRLVTKKKVPGGARPFGVSLTPAGDRIAVGFQDSSSLSVLSGQDLALLYAPDAHMVTGNLAAVAWSANGQTLYAGGTYRAGEMHPIRLWPDGGRGQATDVRAAQSTIFHLLPTPDGGVAFGAADPAVGMLDAKGQPRLLHGSRLADYAEIGDALRLSADGATVRFASETGGKAPVRFSLADRILEPAAATDAALTPPLTVAPDLKLTDWKKSVSPKLNGQPILLEPNEQVFSLAVAPDARTFVLGTHWSLLLLDRGGAIRWKTAIPAAALGVNIARNGRVAVAALADGTLRWYRLSDGHELLSLFMHADHKRWVLWAPSGYFDAGPGAEALIGWHLNRGREAAADFFPVGQFRHLYYRPDVVRRVLETLSVEEAVRLANAESGRRPPTAVLTQQLPPVVRILTPDDGAGVTSPDVTIRVAVRSPSPLTGFKVLVDGRPLATQRGVQVEGRTSIGDELIQNLSVRISARDTELAVIAENQSSASLPAVVRLRWRGEDPAGKFAIKPTLYVLAVGISQYQNTDLALGFAAKDAQDFVTALRTQHGGLYRDVVAKVLTDAGATKDEILDGLDWLRKETTEKDVAVLFLAGHGVNDQSGIYHFLPANANLEKLKRTGVPFSDIKNTLSTLTGKTLAFIDTCHSGNVMGARRGVADINSVVNELTSADNGAVVFASSTGNQYSLEDPAWGNGAFTKALVEGLSGKADYSGKGKITINMLDLYLSERVKELTQGRQTPTTTKPQTVPDFPVAFRQK